MAVLNTKTVAKQLAQFSGNMAAVARANGVTRQAVALYVKDRPTLRQLVLDTREARIDNAESALDRGILNGEAWAVTLTLKSIGRKRGYGDKLEIGNLKELSDEELIAIATGGSSGAFAQAGNSD